MALDKNRSSIKKYYWWWIVVVSFLLLLSCILVVMTYRVTREIDISSGMEKEKVEVFGIAVNSKVNDTRFSQFVKENIGVNNPPSWRTEGVYRLSLLRRRPSPHYVYHGAFQSLNSLMDAFEVADIDKSRKQYLVQQALAYLQKGNMFTVRLDRNEQNIEFLIDN